VRRARWVSGRLAGDGDEDMPPLVAVTPFVELAHAGLQHLIGVEARVLAQQRPRQRGDQRLRRVVKREMACHQASRQLDLPLPVEGIEQGEVEQALLGHSTIVMTMRYAHVAPSTMRAAIELLNPRRFMTAEFGQPAVNQWAADQQRRMAKSESLLPKMA
jgi:hypothetical protein